MTKSQKYKGDLIHPRFVQLGHGLELLKRLERKLGSPPPKYLTKAVRNMRADYKRELVTMVLKTKPPPQIGQIIS